MREIEPVIADGDADPFTRMIVPGVLDIEVELADGRVPQMPLLGEKRVGGQEIRPRPGGPVRGRDAARLGGYRPVGVGGRRLGDDRLAPEIEADMPFPVLAVAVRPLSGAIILGSIGLGDGFGALGLEIQRFGEVGNRAVVILHGHASSRSEGRAVTGMRSRWTGARMRRHPGLSAAGIGAIGASSALARVTHPFHPPAQRSD